MPYGAPPLDGACLEALIKGCQLAPAFEATVARLSADALRELQGKRFLGVMASDWRIPFYSHG
jgi:hypothetical protein